MQTKSKKLMFWPGVNSQIEDVVSKCSACLTHRNKRSKEQTIISDIPSLLWCKVGTDLSKMENSISLWLIIIIQTS